MPNSLAAITKSSDKGGLNVTDLITAASALVQDGKIDDARRFYRDWIMQNGQHPFLHVAYFNLSTLDSQQGDTSATIIALKQAIALKNDFMPAYINLGGQLERTGKNAEAIEQWRSIVNRPALINGMNVGYVFTALKQMARVLMDLDVLEPAEEALTLALGINPERQVIEHYLGARYSQCKWPVVVPNESVSRAQLVSQMAPLTAAIHADDPLFQLGNSDRYAISLLEKNKTALTPDRRNAPIDFPKRRLKVGYVSSDLRDHAIGYLMAELFELHGRNDIEVFAYYSGIPSDSLLSKRIKAAVEHWTDIKPLSDDEAAEKIASDGIDILVDVNGYTRDARTGIFAHRPAPIQVNWLGYPGTMATPFHHYIIADDWIIPEGSEIFYSEKVLRLPCYQPNDRKRQIAPKPNRANVGLPEDAFVFCCFNGSQKFLRFTFDRWMSILSSVPNSVLWLLAPSKETQARLRAYAENRGICGDRIIFAPKIYNPDHLARYALADLFLDTFPYGAHTTASDALWMGVPILTLSGRSFASRVCGSLARSAGLEDLVCSRPEDYVELAVALGNDHKRLSKYKKKLAENKHGCTLFDTQKLVHSLENLYRSIASDYNKGKNPCPNLTNLPAYLEAGLEFDHEAAEMLSLGNYLAFYRDKLAALHQMRPLPPDERLWTELEIGQMDGNLIRLPKKMPLTARKPSAKKSRKAVTS